MPTYTSAGADAAGQYDQMFRELIARDPDVQAVIRGVWGDTPVNARPSDTPKNLEHANDQASKQIAQILASKGIELPDRTFVNPRTGALEGHRGWSGLSGLQKAAIIAAAGATGVGALGAMGVLGGTTAAGTAAGGTAASAAPAAAAGTAATGAAAGGGGLMATLPTVLKGGAAIANAVGGAATANRGAAEGAQLQRDSLGLGAANAYENALLNRADLDLKQRDFARTSETDAFQKALRSALALNFSPVARPDGVPTVSFVGKGIGDQGRMAAQTLSDKMLQRLKTGEQFETLPAPERYTPAPAQGASTTEKLMNILGPSLTVASTLSPNIWSKLRF